MMQREEVRDQSIMKNDMLEKMCTDTLSMRYLDQLDVYVVDKHGISS